MKNNFIFAVITATVIMCMSACTQKNEPDVLPEIVTSEVIGSGIDGNIAVSTSTDDNGISKQTLSYKSWIKVKGQTKADFDNTVTVNLTNTLFDTDTTTFYKTETVVVWGNLDLSQYSKKKEYRVRGTRQEGFVTVTDSVLVYTVDYGVFRFNYELDYEVPVYDDGITREVMPYYRIENLVDKGVITRRIETVDDGEFVYARKQIVHTITVDCNGKTYTVRASVILCMPIGNASEPYVKKSNVLSWHAYSAEPQIISLIRVKRTWSDGSETIDDITVGLNAFIVDYPINLQTIMGYNSPLALVSSSLAPGRESTYETSEQYQYVIYEYAYQNWNIQYNYFSITVELFHNEAYYDDGFTCYKFPNFEYSDILSLEPQLIPENSGYNDKGHYQVYWVQQTVTAKFDKLQLEKTAVFEMDAYN